MIDCRIRSHTSATHRCRAQQVLLRGGYAKVPSTLSNLILTKLLTMQINFRDLVPVAGCDSEVSGKFIPSRLHMVQPVTFPRSHVVLSQSPTSFLRGDRGCTAGVL